MPGSYITFTDATGAATLSNGMTAIAGGVGSRFVSWNSDSNPFGPEKNALGTGQLYKFTFRTDYTASFEIQDIPNSSVTIIDRFLAWLRAGGQVHVYTGDNAAREYATCCLAPGARVTKRMFNNQDITWAVSMTLLNVASTPVPMTCIYDA